MNTQPVLTWISVEDRLPPPHTHVWCLNADGRQFEGCVCYGMHAPFFTYPHGDGNASNTAPRWINVTHWRDLPSPPTPQKPEPLIQKMIEAYDADAPDLPPSERMANVARVVVEAMAEPSPSVEAAISPSDPSVILAGIKQFGLAPDGSDLRDLRSAIERLAQERDEARANTNKVLCAKSETDREIGRMSAQVQTLRKALEKIRDIDYRGHAHSSAAIARAALGEA